MQNSRVSPAKETENSRGNARLSFGGPIRPERLSEAIAAGRGPSKAPGKTKNRDIGKIKKGRKRPIKRAKNPQIKSRRSTREPAK